MWSTTVVALLTAFAQVHGKELATDHFVDAQDSMDKFLNKLANRLIDQTHTLQGADLDGTTFGKTGHQTLGPVRPVASSMPSSVTSLRRGNPVFLPPRLPMSFGGLAGPLDIIQQRPFAVHAEVKEKKPKNPRVYQDPPPPNYNPWRSNKNRYNDRYSMLWGNLWPDGFDYDPEEMAELKRIKAEKQAAIAAARPPKEVRYKNGWEVPWRPEKKEASKKLAIKKRRKKRMTAWKKAKRKEKGLFPHAKQGR